MTRSTPRTRRCQLVWRMTCQGCTSAVACKNNNCPCTRAGTKVSIHDGEEHDRLFDTFSEVLQILQNEPDTTRAQLLQSHALLTKPSMVVYPDGDQDVLTTSVRIGFATNCSAIDYSSDQLELGTTRTFWQDEEPFTKFVERYFPIRSHPVLSHPESTAYLDLKSDLSALTIRNALGIDFLPTEDIRDHLRLDSRRRVVEVFHHTSLLKEHLKRSKDMPPTATTGDYIRQSGTLPRQLVLEVLDSLQAILFPLTDKKSRQLLTDYVNSGAFDPDMLKFEFASIRNKGEENVSYVYLTERLSALHHELQNPRPRGWLERQLELRSGARYVMMASMIGIAVAVLLGFLALVVSIFQAYVAYQAWKYPVAAAVT